jgi:glycerol 2-dehydrogenase (NADP+)
LSADKHIDTAAAYKNEKEVGQGIKASGVPRESFFLTTKLDNPDQGEAEQALEASLSALGTDYLDLWLMHWPAPHTKENPPKPLRSIDWIGSYLSCRPGYDCRSRRAQTPGRRWSASTRSTPTS